MSPAATSPKEPLYDTTVSGPTLEALSLLSPSRPSLPLAPCPPPLAPRRRCRGRCPLLLALAAFRLPFSCSPPLPSALAEMVHLHRCLTLVGLLLLVLR